MKTLSALAGLVLGAACGMAIGIGSLWWLGVPAALVLLVLCLPPNRWRPHLAVAAPCTLLCASATGAMSYPHPVSGAINSAVLAVVTLGVAVAITTWRAARYFERRELATSRELIAAVRAEQHAQVDQALVRERIRMAEFVHDQLGHQLNYTIVRLGTLSLDSNDAAQAQELARVRADLADVLEKIGDVVTLLSDDAATASPEVEAVLQSAGAAGMSISWSGMPPAEIPARVRPDVGHVLAETLANVARHAPGATASITAGVSDDQFVLSVANPAKPGTSHGSQTGLRRIQQRVELIGGRCEITAGEIFSVTVFFPLREMAQLP